MQKNVFKKHWKVLKGEVVPVKEQQIELIQEVTELKKEVIESNLTLPTYGEKRLQNRICQG